MEAHLNKRIGQAGSSSFNKSKQQEKIHVAGNDLNGIIELHCNDYTTKSSSLLLVRSSLLPLHLGSSLLFRAGLLTPGIIIQGYCEIRI